MGRDLETVDVAVLGCGAIGASVAYFLAREGFRVSVIERGGVGSGTSGRCEGNLLLATKSEDAMLELAQRSIELFRELAAELAIPFWFSQEGSLLLYTAGTEPSEIVAREGFLKGRGVGARTLSGTSLASSEPKLGPVVTEALECDDDISVYPPALVDALMDGAISKGATLHLNTDVRRVVRDRDGRVRGVETDAGLIRAHWVVNCMGVWSAPISAEMGVPLPIEPRQGVIVVTESRPGFLKRNVTEAGYIASRFGGPGDQNTSGLPDVTFIAEPTYRGNLLLGSSRVFCGYCTKPPLDIIDQIVRRALLFVPELESVNVLRTFAGLRPWTPDGRPIVSLTDVPGYVVATGHEGEGIGLAPVTGRIVTDLVRDGMSDLPISSLSAHRFSQGLGSI